jgi:hypothetical protein
MMPPSPTPAAAPAGKSSKVPLWVWILTGVGILFMVGMYAAMYWGYNKIQDITKEDIAKRNPEFEMLYFSREGKLKVRHRPTGREFLVIPSGMNKIDLSQLATREVKPVPEWLKLRDADANAAKNGWDRAGDTESLIDGLDDILRNRDFETSVRDHQTLTACNAKQLQCVVIRYGLLEDRGDRSWYSATFFATP